MIPSVQTLERGFGNEASVFDGEEGAARDWVQTLQRGFGNEASVFERLGYLGFNAHGLNIKNQNNN